MADLPQLPIDKLIMAQKRGAHLIQKAGLHIEPAEVTLAVEQHRWAWRPEQVRLILIAESHVYTSAEDSILTINQDLLPIAAHHAPLTFVRLVYCLGYGENELLSGFRKPEANDGGTWQFWDIFGRIAGKGLQPRKGSATLLERLTWKVDTLQTLQDKGVWLLDSSLQGVYASGNKRVPSQLVSDLQRVWSTHYGGTVLDLSPAVPRWVIGAGVAKSLTNMGVTWNDYIYQPQGVRTFADKADQDRRIEKLVADVERVNRD